jgi:hypothetical protein
MNKTQQRRVTDRFTIVTADGKRLAVIETTTFTRVEYEDGSWSDEKASNARLTTTAGITVHHLPNGGYQVNTTPPMQARRDQPRA